LDILLYGDEIIQTERLTVPHYDMHNREFVIVPLAEIAPNLILPNGQKLAELADRFTVHQMEKC
jgi:7,8-dihydro-6-hydroxymethylpterin-pyrophosphokinase (HPPK)